MQDKSTRRVLVVEDAPNWQRIIGELIQEVAGELGFSVETVIASSFEGALAYIDTSSFDCITVDNKLGNITMANTLLHRIANLKKRVPVVVVSGVVEPNDVRNFFKDYNIEEFFWKKGFRPKEFRETLASLLLREMSGESSHTESSEQQSHKIVGTEAIEDAQGERPMQPPRTLLDWLVDTLDLLRHNARNVLVERWEKRNLGKAVTPPVFDDRPLTREDLRASLPPEAEILSKLRSYRKVDGTTRVVTVEHIQSLQNQMITAQRSVDRHDEALSRSLAATERISVQERRDERI